MIYNSIVFICCDEEWKPVTYHDIEPNKYEVSNLGRFRKVKSKRILYGCNENNERGKYKRISLKSISGKQKKYPMHRIVLYTFGDYDEELEVNHINHNKNDNSIDNLNKMTRKENAEDAAEYDLYEFGEDRHNAVFTNAEVHQICKLLEKGFPVSSIVEMMDLKNRGSVYSNIDKIINGKSWVRISSQYNIDYNKFHYKTYKYEDILLACDYVFNTDLKNREIAYKFPQYNTKKFIIMLKGLRKRRIYKKVIKDFESSTTRERLFS